MRALIQRVSQAHVKICQSDFIKGKISRGLLVLVAVEDADTPDDAQWLAAKICGLRIFEDSEGKMNLSVVDIGGEILVVSQFTLYGNVRKGFRPSFNRSAHPDISLPLYEKFVAFLESKLAKKVPTGEFGAMMEVGILNDGPVTIIIDTKNKDL